MKHFALIPAKKDSSRYPNKNWRNFIDKYSLVDFTLRTMPRKLFYDIIVSTDKMGYKAPKGIGKHLRPKSLSGKDSHIEDLIQFIIHEYQIRDQDYLWVLNPTTPFRLEDDYRSIARIIDKKKPISIISVVKIHPFIWKDKKPIFKTKGKRCNTQDFKEEYHMENGMFFVVKAGYFRKNNSWYGKNSILYKQHAIWCFSDIDTRDDFIQAQKIGATFFSSLTKHRKVGMPKRGDIYA